MRIFFMSIMLLNLSFYPVPLLHADEISLQTSSINTAIQKSISLIEKASAGSARERKCFTCHNQALAILVLSEAKQRGFTVNKSNFLLQIEHTSAHLKRGLNQYRTGKGQGGGPDTASFALWTLELAGQKPDKLTTAVIGYLLERDKEQTHWTRNSTRPPSMSSDINTSYFVMRALKTFGTEDQQPQINQRINQTRKWLLDLKPESTEDRVFQLRSFLYLNVQSSITKKAIEELINTQNTDGGWSQLPTMKSDAYATGTALVALLRSNHVEPNHPELSRGIQYLIDTQKPDGSWHVTSHAKPFQTYFETGYPYGKDQFISVTASSWATTALLLSLSKHQMPKSKKQ